MHQRLGKNNGDVAKRWEANPIQLRNLFGLRIELLLENKLQNWGEMHQRFGKINGDCAQRWDANPIKLRNLLGLGTGWLLKTNIKNGER